MFGSTAPRVQYAEELRDLLRQAERFLMTLNRGHPDPCPCPACQCQGMIGDALYFARKLPEQR